MRAQAQLRGLLFAAAIVATACAKTPEPTATTAPSASPPKATPTVAAAPPAQAPKPAAGPSNVAWDVPTAWQVVPNPNAMRKATYKIPKAAGDPEDAELAVSTAGGSTTANIDRWAGQFEKGTGSPPKTEEKKVGDLKVTIVELHGTFAGSGMPGAPASGPKTSWAMLAAIVESSPEAYFFKMTGPDKTVAAARADFDKLVDSLKAK